MNIQFSPPDITDLEISEITAALRSGWITTGPKTKLFEKKIAEYCGVNTAVCLNSATACLELILRRLGIGPGDEVITSAYTYTASASVIDHVGAKIVFVDVEPGTYHIDYQGIADAVTEKTKAVIPVDIGGVMVDYDKVFAAVQSKRALFAPSDNDIQRALGRAAVVADAAHSFGAVYHGKKSGSVADFSAFSFHAVKNLTTAEGGALTWRPIPGISDDDLYHWFMLYSLHGQSKDALSKMKLGSWEYDIIYPAYKCNMTDLTAAMGLVQLQRFDGLSERRKHVIREYDRTLLPLGIERLEHFGGDEYEGNGHLYLMRVPGITESKRNEIIVKMAEAGIACNVHFKPLPMMTAYRKLGFDIKDYPNAFDQYANEITLPLHTLLTDDDVIYITRTLSKILKDEMIQNRITEDSLNFEIVHEYDREAIKDIAAIIQACGDKMFLDDGLMHWSKPVEETAIVQNAMDYDLYVAREKETGQVIATFYLTTKTLPNFYPDKKSTYIRQLAVAPNLWGKGVGTICMRKALEYARERNCACLRGDIYEKSRRSVALIEKMGFRRLYEVATKHFVVTCVEREIDERE